MVCWLSRLPFDLIGWIHLLEMLVCDRMCPVTMCGDKGLFNLQNLASRVLVPLSLLDWLELDLRSDPIQSISRDSHHPVQ
jgi:hypothetical protein